MKATPKFTRIDDLDQANLAALVRSSEAEGFRFLRRLERDWHDGSNRFAERGEILLAAYEQDAAVAVGGLNVDPYSTESGVARLRHLYIRPDRRWRGIGRALVEELLRHAAHGGFLEARLRTETRQASAFYERLGFELCPNAELATHRRDLTSAAPRKPP